MRSGTGLDERAASQTGQHGPLMAKTPIRIAMWSGPRNISTALMRSFEARGDTAVCDEPLYAHYLLATGRPHPGAEEVIAHNETDWRMVAKMLTAPIPHGKPIFYQKHMAHHLLPHIELDWLDEFVNCFLIRDPAETVPSLARFIEDPTVQDTGLPQQVRLFDHLRHRARCTPPVLDAHDILTDPTRAIRALCEAVGVDFAESMLKWAPGLRPTDGIWARHWYDAVARSPGFEPFRPQRAPIPMDLRGLVDECRVLYRTLSRHRIVR